MRYALLCLLLASCVRDKLARVTVPEAGALPFVPLPVTINTDDGIVESTEVDVAIAADICEGQPTDCGYQLLGGTRYSDWTDCGTALPARSNEAGSKDAQDATCAPGLSFHFTLREREESDLQIRTRNARGNISLAASVSLRHVPDAPAAPANVRVTATRNGVIVTWDEVLGADGYHVYYGGALPTGGMDARQVLSGVDAFEGESPLTTNDDENSIRLNNFPVGAPVYVAVSTFDELDRESELSPVVSAIPSEVPLRVRQTIPADASFTPRAVATRGDLVIVVGNDSTPHTVVRSYDLADLTSSAAAQPLHSLTLSDETVRMNLCEFLDGEGNTTLAAAPKTARFFGRYVFVTTGMGDSYALDTANPSALRVAWHDEDQPAAPQAGCAFNLDIVWPYVMIADGVPPGPNDGSADTNIHRVRLLRFAEAANDPPTLHSIPACGCHGCTEDAIRQGICNTSACGANVWFPVPMHHVSAAHLATDNFGAGFNFQPLTQELSRGSEMFNNYDVTACHQAANGIGAQSFPAFVEPGSSGAFVATLATPQYTVLKGPYADEAGTPANSGRLSVFEGDTDNRSGIYEFATSRNVLMTRPSMAHAVAGRFVFVGNERRAGTARGIDILETGANAPRFIGLHPTNGDVRGLAIAGPYLIAADSEDGLIVAALFDGRTLNDLRTNNTVTASNLLIRGGRMLTSRVQDAGADGPQIQVIRDFAGGPYPAAGGGTDYCWALTEEAGRVVCIDTQRSNSPPQSSDTWIALTDSNAYVMPWNPIQRKDFNNSFQPITPALHGPSLYVTFTDPSASNAPRLATLALSANGGGLETQPSNADDFNASASVPLTATFSTRYPAPQLVAEGSRLAVENDTGVSLYATADPDAPTSVSTHPSLFSPVLGVDALCGLEIGAATAGFRPLSLACYPYAGGAPTRVSAGTTTATKAFLAKRGDLAAIGTVGEGMRLLDLTVDPPVVRASVSLDLVETSPITLEGPFVYGACSFGACELRLLP